MKYKSLSDTTIDVKKDYSKQIVFNPDDFLEKGHVLQIVTIPPQTRQRLHVHAKQTEIYYVLDGETVIHINGIEYHAKPGDAFICEPKDTHFLWNKSDKAFRLIVFKYNKDEHSDDTEWLES
jgi:quercetin dioxygenase-like cupin family protein